MTLEYEYINPDDYSDKVAERLKTLEIQHIEAVLGITAPPGDDTIDAYVERLETDIASARQARDSVAAVRPSK